MKLSNTRSPHGFCFGFHSRSEDITQIFQWFEGLSKMKIKKKIDYFGKYKVKRTESCIV